MANCRASVAMAVYNGEKYIKQQLDSIIVQLGDKDELVISYNDSTDDTWNIITQYAQNDNRIKIYRCDKKDVKENFNNAIIHCGGEYIFLSDQDDVWLPGKVNAVIDCFQKNNCDVVLHDCIITDADLKDYGRRLFNERHSSNSLIRNIIKNSYHGCCMAFHSRMIDKIIPIPSHIPLHDSWIGYIGNIYGQVVLLYTPLILYRRHTDNCSSDKRQKLQKCILDRLQLSCALLSRCLKLYLERYVS